MNAVNSVSGVNTVTTVNDVNTPTVEAPTDLPPLDDPTAGTSCRRLSRAFVLAPLHGSDASLYRGGDAVR